MLAVMFRRKGCNSIPCARVTRPGISSSWNMQKQNRRSSMLTIKSIFQDGSASRRILKQSLLYRKNFYSWRVQYSLSCSFLSLISLSHPHSSRLFLCPPPLLLSPILSPPTSFPSSISLSSPSFLSSISLSSLSRIKNSRKRPNIARRNTVVSLKYACSASYHWPELAINQTTASIVGG